MSVYSPAGVCLKKFPTVDPQTLTHEQLSALVFSGVILENGDESKCHSLTYFDMEENAYSVLHSASHFSELQAQLQRSLSTVRDRRSRLPQR